MPGLRSPRDHHLELADWREKREEEREGGRREGEGEKVGRREEEGRRGGREKGKGRRWEVREGGGREKSEKERVEGRREGEGEVGGERERERERRREGGGMREWVWQSYSQTSLTNFLLSGHLPWQHTSKEGGHFGAPVMHSHPISNHTNSFTRHIVHGSLWQRIPLLACCIPPGEE